MKDACAIAKRAWGITCNRGPFVVSVVSLIVGIGFFVRAYQTDARAERTPKPAKFRYEADASIDRINGTLVLALPVLIAMMRMSAAYDRSRARNTDLFFDEF